MDSTANTTINKQKEQIMLTESFHLDYGNGSKVINKETECKNEIIFQIQKQRMELNYLVTIKKKQTEKIATNIEEMNKEIQLLHKLNAKDLKYIGKQEKEIQRLTQIINKHTQKKITSN